MSRSVLLPDFVSTAKLPPVEQAETLHCASHAARRRWGIRRNSALLYQQVIIAR